MFFYFVEAFRNFLGLRAEIIIVCYVQFLAFHLLRIMVLSAAILPPPDGTFNRMGAFIQNLNVTTITEEGMLLPDLKLSIFHFRKGGLFMYVNGRDGDLL